MCRAGRLTFVLHINDLFWTIQGEGRNAGRRALFVRMPYCNLACEWCDTSFNSFKPWTEEALIAFAEQEKGRFAVITGGEPMLNKHTPRVAEVLDYLKFDIAVESNGTVAPNIHSKHFFTVSPKRQAADKKLPAYFVHPDMWVVADEFKYVVDEQFDFSILDRHKDDKINPLARLSLSPEFNNMKASLEKIIAYQKENPRWRISLQTHKWMQVP